jgi:hypothetical protein
MLCTLSRWMISRSEDSGNKIPRFIERHVVRCAACGDFARSSASLSSRLREERSAWLAKVPDFPAGLTRELEAVTPGSRTVKAGRPLARRSLFGLRPLPVAATALVVVAAALVLFQVVPKGYTPSAQDRAAGQAAIKSLTSAPQGLQSVIGGAESSLEREGRILEESLSSAVEYLQARLNIKIERKDPPKPI